MSKLKDNYISASLFFRNPSDEEIEKFGKTNAIQLRELEADKKANWLFSAGTVACVGAGFTIGDILTSDETTASEAISYFIAPLITQIIVLSRTNMVYRRIGKQLKQRMIDNKTTLDELTLENINLTNQNTMLQQQIVDLKNENDSLRNLYSNDINVPSLSVNTDESDDSAIESEF